MIDSLEKYVSILESDDNNVRRIAATSDTSVEVWKDILSRRPDLAFEVAMNKQLPKSVIDILIQNNNADVRCTVAMKRSLDSLQCEILAKDAEDSVRIMIANNKKTPVSLLELLQNDSCNRVSLAASNQLRNRRTGD